MALIWARTASEAHGEQPGARHHHTPPIPCGTPGVGVRARYLKPARVLTERLMHVCVCDTHRSTIGDVELPPWAHGSAERFVRIHMEALNSSIVSAKLNAWVDLVFG